MKVTNIQARTSIRKNMAQLERENLELRKDLLRLGSVLGQVVMHLRVPIRTSLPDAERLMGLKSAPAPPAEEKSRIISPHTGAPVAKPNLSGDSAG